MIIKKWNDTTNAWVELYPKTKASELYASDGTTGIFDSNTKVKAAYLPDFVFGGLQFKSAIGSQTDSSFATNLDSVYQDFGTDSISGMIGKYFVATTSFTLETANATQAGSTGRYYSWDTLRETEEDAPDGNDLVLEHGDWIVIQSISGSGTSGSPYAISLSVVNNTYQSATADSRGIVKLGSGTAQSTSANAVSNTAARTYAIQNDGNGRLVVNVPWSDTNTTYSTATSSALGLIKLGSDTEQSVAANSVSSTSGRTYAIQLNSSDQAVVNVPWSDTNTFRTVIAGGNTLGTSETLTLSAGSNVSITESAGTVTINSTDTNTTYTAGEGLTLSGTEFRSTYPLYVGASAPTVATADEVDNAIWFDL